MPGYHYFTAALLLLNLGYALVAVVRHPAARAKAAKAKARKKPGR